MPTLPELLKTTVEMDGSDLHLTTDTPPQVRVHGELERLPLPDAVAGRDEAAGLQRADRRAEEAVRGDARARLLVRHPGPGAVPLQRVQPAWRHRGGLPADSRADPHLRRARAAARARATRRAAARAGAGDRADRQRQVDDAGGDARQDQHRAPRAHPHHRGSDRVHPPAQGLPGEPARGPQRHAGLRAGAARGAARGPRRRAHRRDARPGDGRSRPADRRDRPPDVRHAAHELGGPDDQPHHRRLPGAPAGADPHAALARARGHRLPGAAAAAERRGAGRVARDPGADPGHPQPDPRGQDPPDLLGDADRAGEGRHADDEPVAGDACSRSG